MTIFNTYTGNAMLNNALMTIESLAGLEHVSGITPDLLQKLYSEKNLKDLNKRLKSYTMLFTKNGPLHNDKQNGDRIYDSLFKTIVSKFENEGSRTCEISGLSFDTPFHALYEKALGELGFSSKEIQKKDTTIGRTWFPLIGGLGSDAQALPQAKFAIQIHPICIVILQFLPLSSLLYNGGILLVDSSNFDLPRRMIDRNRRLVEERAGAVSVSESIENIRDSKGNYLIKALESLKEKELFDETYSDLNLWSFSNSGTGASCQIDRIPNTLIRKLTQLDANPRTAAELKSILNNNFTSSSFLEALEGNRDWHLLYPAVLGSGKNKVEHNGYSSEFLESYYHVIGKGEMLEIARYISFLISKYKTKYFDKLPKKSDAWNEPEYRIEIVKVLALATEKNEWSLEHQIAILDDKEKLPVNSSFRRMHRLIHFYWQRDVDNIPLPAVEVHETAVFKACEWVIALAQNYSGRIRITESLRSPQENESVSLERVFLEALENTYVEFMDICDLLVEKENFYFSQKNLNELLRIFFSQPIQAGYNLHDWVSETEDVVLSDWLQRIVLFAEQYQSYYFEKYRNQLTGRLPTEKFRRLVKRFEERSDFYLLFSQAVENTNTYLAEHKGGSSNQWDVENLLLDPLGNRSNGLSRWAIVFSLKQQSLKSQTTDQLITQ